MDLRALYVAGAVGLVFGVCYFLKKYRRRFARYAIVDSATGACKSWRTPGDFVRYPVDGVTTLYESFQYAATKYADRDCIGVRPTIRIHNEEKIVDGLVKKRKLFELGPYHFETYAETWQNASFVGSGFRHIGLQPGDRIGLYLDTTREWTLMEQGAYTQNMTILTVYANLGLDGLLYALRQGEIRYLCTTESLLRQISGVVEELRAEGFIDYLVVVEQQGLSDKEREVIEGQKAELESKGIRIYSFDQVLELGRADPLEHTPPKPEDINCIMYTSGSTGIPKGVLISHATMLSALSGFAMIFAVKSDDVYLNYLPLAHVLALTIENAALHKGVPIGYGTPWTLTDLNMKNCKGDFAELRPTLMAGVPMVYDKVKKGVEERLAGSPLFKRVLFKVAFQIKMLYVDVFGLDTPLLNALVFDQFKSALGGRCRLIVSGGAPLSAEVQHFMQLCFSAPVLQGYGLTETCGAGTVMEMDDRARKCVGPPIPCCEIKLVDVPEMGYLTTANPPRGEVWVRGPNITTGYYKNPEKTQEVITEDKWFMTGDIGQWNENGTLRIIDRKKNLIKGPHGEYIALEKLEAVYKNSQFIRMICVYADSERLGNMAFVFPNEDKCKRWAAEKGIDASDLNKLYRDASLIKAIVNDCNEVGRANRLQRFEEIQDLLITPDEWTPDNQMLTAAFKLNRNVIYHNFRHDLDLLYSKHSSSSSSSS